MATKKTGRKTRTMAPENAPIRGEKIRAMLVDRDWSQEKLARKSGIPLGTISRIVRGVVDPQVSTFIKIVDALDCSADTLLRRATTKS